MIRRQFSTFNCYQFCWHPYVPRLRVAIHWRYLLSGNHPPETSDEKTPLLGVDSMEKSDMNGLEHQEIPEKKGMTKNKLLVVVCILMCELCERLTYYSCVANLVLYCTSKLELPTSTATTVSLIFSGKNGHYEI